MFKVRWTGRPHAGLGRGKGDVFEMHDPAKFKKWKANGWVEKVVDAPKVEAPKKEVTTSTNVTKPFARKVTK